MQKLQLEADRKANAEALQVCLHALLSLLISLSQSDLHLNLSKSKALWCSRLPQQKFHCPATFSEPLLFVFAHAAEEAASAASAVNFGELWTRGM